MKQSIALLIAAASSALALAAILPVLADAPGAAPACVRQDLNPHPTDPAGQTTNTLFCTSPSPTPTATTTPAGGKKSGGSGGSGGSTSAGPNAGSTGGGSQTTLATTTEPGSDSSAFDSGARVDGRPDYANGTSEPSSGVGSSGSGGLIGFFSAAGGLVFLFGLLIILMLIGIGAAVLGWLRSRGRTPGWAERASRITFRA